MNPLREANRWLLKRVLRRRQAYAFAFLADRNRLTPNGEIILKDLARFCYAHKPTVLHTPTGAIDPLGSARLAGRRDVWLRMIEHLHLDDSFLVNLREGPNDDGTE